MKIMWHEKQNMIFPGQMMGPPRPQATSVENMILQPPFGIPDKDFLAESSRKRKATALDQQGSSISDGTFLEYRLARESIPQHRGGTVPLNNVQSNNLGAFNLTSQSGEPNTKGNQFEKHQVHDLSNFSTSWQTNDANFPKYAVKKLNSSCSSMQPQSFHHKGPGPLLKSPVGEILSVPNQRPLPHNMFSQTEAHKFPAFVNPSNACMGKAQGGLALKDGKKIGHENCIAAGNPTGELNVMSSESLRSSAMSEHSLVKNDKFTHYEKFDGIVGSQDISMFGSSTEVKQCAQSLNIAGTKNVSGAGTSSLEPSVCIEGKENDRSSQNPSTESSNSLSDVGLGSNMKSRVQSHGDPQNSKKIEGSNMENAKDLLGEKISPENVDSPAKIRSWHGQGYDRHNGSLNMEGKSKSNAGKVAPSIVEKLWDGSLQLNASVTVSAVAFFKSGEKAPEVNWSKFVEVKGKVRLEAFEKFIQELPRSRNRGLMVISLCWKVGSSKAGLTGMKEVAKSYKEGERVGLAQLSAGVDLYVCPRNDTIITILAKYGFFKGMAAVDDDQDSLIGCVVWRRNLTSSNSGSKKSERKNLALTEKTLNSTSDSTIQQNEETNSSLVQSQASSPLVSGTICTTLERARSIDPECRIVQSSSLQLEVGSSLTSANPKPSPVPNNSSDIPVGLQSAPHSDSSSMLDPRGQPLQVEVPLVSSSEPGKTDASLELPKPVLSIPPQIVKQHTSLAPDDDDLPEFDFRTACGISPSAVSKPLFCNSANDLDAVKKCSSEGSGKVDGAMPSMLPIKMMTATSQQRSQKSNFLGLALDMNRGMPPVKNLGEQKSQVPILPLLEGKPMVHNNDVLSRPGSLKRSNGAPISPPKNRWDDDDDDMPEWCPPDQEHRKQPPAVANVRPSIPYIPSPFPNPSLDNVSPVPPWPRLPSPSQVPIRPPCPQGLPRGYQHCPITITVKPAHPRPVGGYIQRGTSSLFGFNSSPSLRPQHNVLDVKHPIRPAGWRGRGP